jgi:hypothetical protein
MKGKEGNTMASKRAANGRGKGQEVMFAPGTRHEYIPTLASLTRVPIQDMTVMAMPDKVASGQRKDFILALLTQAGPQGLTWGEIRQALIEAYGSAPKKRASLYALLSGVQWFKTTGAKGVVTYHLGKEPRRGKGKSK